MLETNYIYILFELVTFYQAISKYRTHRRSSHRYQVATVVIETAQHSWFDVNFKTFNVVK